MKRKTNLLALLVTGALAVTSLTACSDDDSPALGGDRENPTIANQWSGVQSEMWEVANQYINNVVFPTYSNLASSADELYQQAVNMQQKHTAGTLTDSDVEAACDAFEPQTVAKRPHLATCGRFATDFGLKVSRSVHTSLP